MEYDSVAVTNGLALMNTHRDMSIATDTIVDSFRTRSQPRRMELTNRAWSLGSAEIG